jgi:DNA polymerase III delta subunit
MDYPAQNKTRPPQRTSVYLLIGQDAFAKETQLNKIKKELLLPQLADFNLDTLYASEVALKDIQERIKSIPLKSAKRLVVIKDAQRLDGPSRDFLLALAKNPPAALTLVLDFEQYDFKDRFVREISPRSMVLRFKETVEPDAFTLNRQIELKKTDAALRILNQLLKNGEPAERILGGLRYAWEKQDNQGVASRKKLKLLLNCDLEIKTGKLKPAYALEKLVISLCAFT